MRIHSSEAACTQVFANESKCNRMRQPGITFIIDEPLPQLASPLIRALQGQTTLAANSLSVVDSSSYLHDEATLLDELELADARAALVEDGIFADPSWIATYVAEGIDEEFIVRAAVKYGWALAHLQCVAADRVDRSLVWSVAMGGETTSAMEFLLLGREIRRRELDVTWIAPCTPARFEAGIDYGGDLETFTTWLHTIPRMPMGLLLPNANGKLALLPHIGSRDDLTFSLSLERLSWLEALRLTAKFDPAFFRALLAAASEQFAFDKEPHALSTGEDDIRSLPDVPDTLLETTFLDDFRGRQLLHVTAQTLVAEAASRERITRLISTYHSEFESLVLETVQQHLNALKAAR